MVRGEIWLADLNPTRGSEQAGIRPVLVLQNDSISNYSTTVVAIPLTTNLRRASLPTCVLVRRGEGGLSADSVLLCHHIRAIDKTRLRQRLGKLKLRTMEDVEDCMLFTLGIV